VTPDRLRLRFNPRANSAAAVDESLIAQLKEVGVTLTNRKAYCFMGLTEDPGGLVVDVGLCDYFQYVSACGALAIETVQAALHAQPHPLRDLHAHSVEALARAPLRAHALGVAATVVFDTGDGQVWLSQERSQNVVTHSGRSAVLPAFAFQPFYGSAEDEFDMQHQFLREFGEEVMGVPELGEDSEHVAHDWFYDRPELSALVKLFQAGRARLSLTGFGFDALNGEPVLTVCVRVLDPAYWQSIRRRIKRSTESRAVRVNRIEEIPRAVIEQRAQWSPSSACSAVLAARSARA